MPELSILVPHYNTPAATRALNVALRRITEHTQRDYELMVTAHTEREFYAYNSMAARAEGDWLVLTCSDMFFAPGWDGWLDAELDPNCALLMTVVEPGMNAPVAEQAICGNFGTTPETFNRAGFEAFAASAPVAFETFGWGFPLIVERTRFLALGGFPPEYIHENVADLEFMRAWERAGYHQRRVPHYCYHLQQWTKTGALR